MKQSGKWSFEPTKSFFQLPIVYWTGGVIFALASIVALIITVSSDLFFQIDLTYSGFNNALEYYKVPLGILAMLIPIGAVYATNHRSQQTVHQVQTTNSQNLFTNYFKHIEEFEKYGENSLTTLDIEHEEYSFSNKINFRHIHNSFYPNLLESGDITTTRSIITFIENHLEGCIPMGDVTISKVERKLSDTYHIISFKLRKKEYGFHSYLESKHSRKLRMLEEWCTGQSNIQQKEEVCLAYIIVDRLYRLQAVLECLDKLAKFDRTFKSSEYMKHLRNAHHVQALMPSDADYNDALTNLQRFKSFRKEHLKYSTFDNIHPITEESFIAYAIELAGHFSTIET